MMKTPKTVSSVKVALGLSGLTVLNTAVAHGAHPHVIDHNVYMIIGAVTAVATMVILKIAMDKRK